MELTITQKQREFLEAGADEVLFGGAAGGGKSYGQLVDALLYALRYPGSKQLILRRTFPDLERSLILVSLELYPKEIASYNSSSHRWKFKNGSLIEFGYCDNEKDVYRYQGAEYDTIRFDELTHFTESMYLYLISRLRGANDYPKRIKSSTNPGGVGHYWVKARFIDLGPAGQVQKTPEGSRLFIPSRVQDNRFLMQKDPQYLRRLENLAEKDKKALLYGDWDIFEGQFFTEWDRSIHVVEPFPIPKEWRRYFAMDYGLDMLAGYWIAVDPQGRAWVYREVYQPDLIVSEAAKAILERDDPEVYQYLAPRDLWNRRQETGRSVAELFRDHGIHLTQAGVARESGWLDPKEWLKPGLDEQGEPTAGLRVFSTCPNLIRTLPALQHDPNRPGDCATEPHELTHAPDAIRYFVAGRPRPAARPRKEKTALPFALQENESEESGGYLTWNGL